MGILGRLLRWSLYAAVAVAVLVSVAAAAHLYWADGPTGPLAGGAFETGTPTPLPPDYTRALQGDFEFELVSTGRSRTAGGLLLDDELYLTCDLGFIWSRVPDDTARGMLNVIYWFKTWHHDAMSDGRIRIRKDDRVYQAVLSRVEDPTKIAALKVALENEASAFFQPDGLGPAPESGPSDVWFFHIAAPVEES